MSWRDSVAALQATRERRDGPPAAIVQPRRGPQVALPPRLEPLPVTVLGAVPPRMLVCPACVGGGKTATQATCKRCVGKGTMDQEDLNRFMKAFSYVCRLLGEAKDAEAAR